MVSNILYFHPYLGKLSPIWLSHICSNGLVQPPNLQTNKANLQTKVYNQQTLVHHIRSSHPFFFKPTSWPDHRAPMPFVRATWFFFFIGYKWMVFHPLGWRAKKAVWGPLLEPFQNSVKRGGSNKFSRDKGTIPRGPHHLSLWYLGLEICYQAEATRWELFASWPCVVCQLTLVALLYCYSFTVDGRNPEPSGMYKTL